MNETKEIIEFPETVADTSFSKTLFINGKKIPGCQRVNIDVDVSDRNEVLLTRVTCTFTIAKDSLSIEDNCIRFDLLDQKLDF